VKERRVIEALSRDVQDRTETVMQLALDRETYLANLRGSKETLVLQMLTITRGALPKDVSLSELVLLESGFVVGGSANDYPEIFQFRENLRASGLFTDVRLTSVQGLTQDSLDFELVATASGATETNAG